MTHVSTPIFQGLFKNIVFQSVALVIKKLWTFKDFFLHTPDFLLTCKGGSPMHEKKNLTKKELTSLEFKACI